MKSRGSGVAVTGRADDGNYVPQPVAGGDASSVDVMVGPLPSLGNVFDVPARRRAMAAWTRAACVKACG